LIQSLAFFALVAGTSLVPQNFNFPSEGATRMVLSDQTMSAEISSLPVVPAWAPEPAPYEEGAKSRCFVEELPDGSVFVVNE